MHYARHHGLLDFSESNSVKIEFDPVIEAPVKSISLRLPRDMLNRLKVLANKKDIPYQAHQSLPCRKDRRRAQSQLGPEQRIVNAIEGMEHVRCGESAEAYYKSKLRPEPMAGTLAEKIIAGIHAGRPRARFLLHVAFRTDAKTFWTSFIEQR